MLSFIRGINGMICISIKQLSVTCLTANFFFGLWIHLAFQNLTERPLVHIEGKEKSKADETF